MRIGRTLLIMAASAVLACGLAGCSQPQQSASSTSDAVTMSVDVAEGQASQAIVLAVDDGTALFADKDNGSVYFPGIPEGQLFGLNGEAITVEGLQPGNVVEVVGNGIMLESYPGQYPGITMITVIEQGSPDDVAPYGDVVSQVFAPADPYEVTSGYVAYRSADADVSVMLQPLSSEWETADGFREVIDGTFVTADGTIAEGTADATIGSATEATIGFGVPFMDVQVNRIPLVQLDDGDLSAGDLSQPGEQVAVEKVSDTEAKLTIEPNYVYTINGFFDNGNATYVFITPSA